MVVMNEKINDTAYTKPDANAESRIRNLLQDVTDPEIPVLTIEDLGIIRKINSDGKMAEVIITPTYSGCPAMDMIGMHIRQVLESGGFSPVKVTTVLSPAWTTDWMSEEGKRKLKAYGIAPPNPRQQVCMPDEFRREEAVECPRCGSFHTKMVSEFGSTACKSLYRCEDCLEPFDYFKCH